MESARVIFSRALSRKERVILMKNKRRSLLALLLCALMIVISTPSMGIDGIADLLGVRAAAASYTLHFDAAGGIGEPTDMTGSGTYTIPSNVPARLGYTFCG